MPFDDGDRIRLAHGFGGQLTQELIEEIILPALTGKHGDALTLDAAVVNDLTPPIVLSTDSFTVSPRFFPGGDIGELAVAGTVNDVAMMGGEPRYLALGLVIEEGFEVLELRRIMASLGNAASMAGVAVVTGDTKVVERGGIEGIVLMTTGFGSRKYGMPHPGKIAPGDAIIITGTIGDHGAAIINARENLGFSKALLSDCASVHGLVKAAWDTVGDDVHALRDPTRGGLAAVLNEFARDTGHTFELDEERIPLRPEVRSFLDLMGLDPLILANEGKVVMIVAADSSEKVVDALKRNPLGANAAIIGRVAESAKTARVILETPIGTRRIVEMPREAGLPRIC